MRYKTELSRETRENFVVVTGIVDGSEYGAKDYEMTHAETPCGQYIGNSEDARRLCDNKGIVPELAMPSHAVCSIGFCASENKWYGWSHRAIYGFGIGSTCSKGDCHFTPDNPEEIIEEHAHWLDWEENEEALSHHTPKEIRAHNEEHQTQRRAECQILDDRSGVRILPSPMIIPMVSSIDGLIDAIEAPGECEAEAIDIAPSFQILKCGRGEWTARTLDDAKQMAINFAEGVL